MAAAAAPLSLTVRQQLLLIRPLRTAGRRLVGGYVLVRLLGALLPAASALALAALVGRLTASGAAAAGTVAATGTGTPTATATATDLMGAALVPLGVFATVLFLTHAVEALSEPLRFAVQARIDGAHRVRVARLAAGSATLGDVEDPRTQELLRLTRADPENWTERTPGQGAITQLAGVLGWLGIVAAALVLARYAWWTVPVVLLTGVLVRRLGIREGLIFYRVWQRGIPEGRRAGVWEEVLTDPATAKEVRVFGFAEWGVQRWLHHVLRMFSPTWAVAERSMRRQTVRFTLTFVGLGAVFAAVALAAAHGAADVGAEAAVFAAAWSVCNGLNGYDARNLAGALPVLEAAEELEARLSPPGHATAAVCPAAEAVGGRPPWVRFEQVGFRYPGTERAVLDGLDLEIRPGELLAIVGLNGAGKSTLIKLLAALYLPTAGRITVDGVDVTDVGAAAWRRRLAVVFQDFVRYQLPLADNVTLGQADGFPADLAVARRAAADAGLEPVLDRLPAGWATPLARSRTGGVDLSGGQWQQVVLARALYALHSGARLLVLDEPTAHLDVRTEFEVFSRLAAHRGDSSVVLISHRLSTVRQADRIVVLDGGRITESGTHDELVALGGSYAGMFAIQAERFARGFDDRVEEGELVEGLRTEGEPV